MSDAKTHEKRPAVLSARVSDAEAEDTARLAESRQVTVSDLLRQQVVRMLAAAKAKENK